MGKPMNLFILVPNANQKQQFCQIVKILLFNERRKTWHMRKKNKKNTKKNTEKRRETGGKRGGNKKKQKNSVFFSFDHVAGHLLGYPCRTGLPFGGSHGPAVVHLTPELGLPGLANVP